MGRRWPASWAPSSAATSEQRLGLARVGPHLVAHGRRRSLQVPERASESVVWLRSSSEHTDKDPRASNEVQRSPEQSASGEIAPRDGSQTPPQSPSKSIEDRSNRPKSSTDLVLVPLPEDPGMAILLTPEELEMVLRHRREKKTTPTGEERDR